MVLKTSHPLIGLLLVLWSLRPASAQSQASAPNCATDAACTALFEQAQQQSKAGNLPEAHRLYKLAYEVQPDPALLYSIARVLHKQGKAHEAVSYYRQFLDSGISAPEQTSKAREYLAELEKATSTAPEGPVTSMRSLAVVPEGSIGKNAPAPDRAGADKKPIYKAWWFWTIVGSTATAVVVGTAVGVAAREPDLSGVVQYRLFPTSM